MAAHQLSLLSINLNKMVSFERKSSSQTTTKLNVSCSIPRNASIDVSNKRETILRRTGNFHPTRWNYDYIQSLRSEYTEDLYNKQRDVLKEEVQGILCRVVNHVDQLEMIDILQRLGIAYHFENDISNILANIYNNIDTFKRGKNLQAIALAFRLLRQHGYNISTDVFISIQDEKGNFKELLSEDVLGLLSLYEASFYSFEDEPILDEARHFTTNVLKEFVNKYRDNDTSLLINHALESPLHWRVSRWDALLFMNVYERMQNVSHAIIQFAKLDFNIVQSFHQEDLKNASRWWKTIGVDKNLSFTRDRLVENFLWGMAMNFRSELEYFRVGAAKVNCIVTIIDDVYDTYGTLEELELFTKAIERWDLNDMDNLPHYMKLSFLALHNMVNEIAFFSLKEDGHNILPYLKKMWGDLAKAYIKEARWYYSGYTPSLEEYLEDSWISVAVPLAIVHSIFLIPNALKKEDLICFEGYPNIIRHASTAFRLADDLASYEREMKVGDVPKSVQCYMNETGASEADACEHIKSILCTTWNKMNLEAHNSSFSTSLIDISVNFARAGMCLYQFGDSFTENDHVIESHILSLIFQPIPMKST